MVTILDTNGNPTTLDVLNERAKEWHRKRDQQGLTTGYSTNCRGGKHAACRGVAQVDDRKVPCACPHHEAA